MDDDSRTDWTLTEVVSRAAVDLQPAALELRGITRRFGAITALHDVSLSAKRGSIHALLGENGAGKTTLMRVAFGMIKPDSGSIIRDGRALELRSPADAIAARIGMVHQQFSLVPEMTVAENVALGGKGRYRVEEVARRIREVVQTTGLSLDPHAKVATLTSAERQKLEIVRTLAHDAEVLILDEPTALLTERDITELFEQLRIFADSGKAVVLITHKLQNAMDHADEVTVLQRGKLVLNAPIHEVSRRILITAMLGDTPQDSIADSTPRHPAVSRPAVVARVSSPALEVFAGEILGVAALEGTAGPLLQSFAGRVGSPSDALDALGSVGFVPENRQEEALIPDFSLTDNLALKNAGKRHGLVDWKGLRETTKSIISQFDVRASGPEDIARNLSGGNQQRFVLGRELIDKPALLVLENPTHGLDVNAAVAVHERMKAAREAGTAIVFYSSDLDELVNLSDRVAVIDRTSITISPPDRDEIGKLLLGMKTTERPVG